LAYALEYGYKVEDYTLAFCNYHDGSSSIRFLENYHRFQFFEFPKPKFRFVNRVKWKFRNRVFPNTQIIENYDPNFELQNLKPNHSYELKGFHFSSGNLALKHRSKICEILLFRENEILPIHNLLFDAQKRYEILVGLHIRQNDFKTFYDGKYFVSVDQYLRSIEHFKSLMPNGVSIGIVVCSDDEKLLMKMQRKHPDYIYPKGNVAQDMTALSKCDYIIGPKATTMSAWASFAQRIPILQIDSFNKEFSISDFKNVDTLEPFTPFLQSN